MSKNESFVKTLPMVENIIYHTVIVIFIIVLFIYALYFKKAFTTYKQDFIPFLLKSELHFPKDRSIFIRTIHSLENELSNLFGVLVLIEYPKKETIFYSDDFKVFFEILSSKKTLTQLEKSINLDSTKKIIFKYHKEKIQTSASSKNKLDSCWEVHQL